MYVLEGRDDFSYVQIAFGWDVPELKGQFSIEMREPTLAEQYNTTINIDNFLHKAGVHTIGRGIFTRQDPRTGEERKFMVVTGIHPTADINNLFDVKLDKDNGLLADDVVSEKGVRTSWRVWGYAYISEPYPDSVLTGRHPADENVINLTGRVVPPTSKLTATPL